MVPDVGQGGDFINGYPAEFLACRKGKGGGIESGETQGRKKEYPIEDEGFNKSGYGCPPF
jgi:hypothetical protein